MVGPPGIEPGLRVPKTRVLPVYYGPSQLLRYYAWVEARCNSNSIATCRYILQKIKKLSSISQEIRPRSLMDKAGLF